MLQRMPPAPANLPTASPAVAAALPRRLGAIAAMAIVVGEVIGSGIFFKPAEVARATQGHLGVILSLWIVCGLINLCGALALAELSAMLPHTGGTYVFLREAYGRAWAFLWAWAEFWVIRTGAIAAMSVYATFSLQELVKTGGWTFTDAEAEIFRRGAAVSFIFILGSINFAGTHWGGGVQTVLTAIKVSFIIILAGLPLLALTEGPSVTNVWWPQQMEMPLWIGMGGALAAIMWAYDGWGNVTVVAEEVRQPERNVPRALIGGVMLLIVLYAAANLAYHLTLPWQEIAKAIIPAQAVCEKLLPGIGGSVMAAMLLISLVGAVNGNILVGPRVLVAVSRDMSELKFFGKLHAQRETPAVAIAAVCAWAMVLVLAPNVGGDGGTLLADWLTTYCIFGGSIFYLSAVLAVFVLRVRWPDAPRPYRAWGYPITPAIFAIFYVFLLGSMLYARPQECLWGLTLIAAGAIVYAIAKLARRASKGKR